MIPAEPPEMWGDWPPPHKERTMEYRDVKLPRRTPATSDAIRLALADPSAPWYGSDLVPLVDDVLTDLESELSALRAKVEAVRAMPDYSSTMNNNYELGYNAALAEVRRVLSEGDKPCP